MMGNNKYVEKLGKASVSLADYLGLLGVLAVEILVFGLCEENFFTKNVFYSITENIPDTVIVAVGMTFVLIVAGIDLSVGSVLAFSQAVLGYCMVQKEWPLHTAILACLAVGLLCGLLNGLVTVRWALPSFIVTLGMLQIARGGTYFVTDSRTIWIGKQIETVSHKIPFCGDITWAFLICIGAVIAGQFVLSRTVFGRYAIAIGTNEEAVRLSGINPKPIKLIIFALCGFCSALAGMIQASRSFSSDPNGGEGFELTVIAAVVIGGTSLMGGRGSVVKSFLGVLIVAVLNAGLVQMNAPEYAKLIVIGSVIVLAVILDFYRGRSRRNA